MQNALVKFQHDCPSQPEHDLHIHTVPIYDAKVQYDTRDDNLENLDDAERNVIQKIVSIFLHYENTIDNTIFTPLSDIAVE